MQWAFFFFIFLIYYVVGSESAVLSRIQTSWRDACALVAYLPRSVVLPGVWAVC